MPVAVKSKRGAFARQTLAALCSGVLAGCIHTAPRIDVSLLADTGARAISARALGDSLSYRMLSFLGGSTSISDCRDHVLNDGAVALSMCGGEATTDLHRLAALLRTAEQARRNYAPGIAVKRLHVHLVPADTAYQLDVRRHSRGDDVEIHLAFRDPFGRDAYLRSLVRSVAHETTHLSDSFERSMLSSYEREFRASLMESCVEAVTFGDTRGYAFAAEASMDSRGFGASQARSIEANKAALVATQPFVRNDDWAGLDAMCRAYFLSPGNS